MNNVNKPNHMSVFDKLRTHAFLFRMRSSRTLFNFGRLHCDSVSGSLCFMTFTAGERRSSAPPRLLAELHASRVSILTVYVPCALTVNPRLALILPVQSDEHHLCRGMLAHTHMSPLCGWTAF